MAERRRGGYFGFPLIYKILIGLILGIIVGAIAGPSIAPIAPLGSFFVRLLKMIMLPIVFFVLVVGAASVSPARGAKMGGKTIGLYILTTFIAILIGLAIANVFKPGLGLELVGAAPGMVKAPPPMKDVLLNIIPTNPFGALAAGNVLQVIVFSVLLGVALSYLKELKVPRISEASGAVLKVFDGLAEATFRLVRWVLEVAPYGVFALIAVVVGKQGAAVMKPVGVLVGIVYLGAIIQYLIVYGGFLKAWGLNPVRFWPRARDASLTAFVTRTSGGTLPVTMRVADERLGIDRRVYGFTLPLGAVINMDGAAVYMAICTLFVANAVGIHLGIGGQAVIVFTAILASIGTAAVPGAGTIMLLLVLESVGLPVVEGSAVAIAYAMILGVDAISDMARTGLNVTGDLACTTIVAKSENMLNLDLWRPRAKVK